MVEATSNSTSILQLVNKTLELPTIPEVLVSLNDVIASDDSTSDDVAEVIAKDPAVSANVLRIVNSAYYGLQVRVSSISLAVSVLGFSMTKKVALKAAIFSKFANEKSTTPSEFFDPRAFWRHSIFTGVAARVIGAESSKLKAHHAEDLYICGLLHDIGKIILAENVPDELDRVLEQAALTNRPQYEVEQEVLGFTHADVGSVLAIKWFLPEDLTIAIRYHHQPTDDPFHRALSALIHLSDHLASSAGHASTQKITTPELQHLAYEEIGIDPDFVEELLPRIEQEFAEISLPF